MTRMLTVSEAKTKFFKLVDGVEGREDEVVVTKNGKPAAILLNYREYHSLLETLEVLSDPKAMARIREAEAQLKQGGGRWLTREEAFDLPLEPGPSR